jgi:hypothetical protein
MRRPRTCGAFLLYLIPNFYTMDVASKFLASDLYAFLAFTSSAQQVGIKKRALNTSAFKAL